MVVSHSWQSLIRSLFGEHGEKGQPASLIDLDRLSPRELADLNLPGNLRAGIELRRSAEEAGALSRW